jgi:hypothetical protein
MLAHYLGSLISNTAREYPDDWKFLPLVYPTEDAERPKFVNMIQEMLFSFSAPFPGIVSTHSTSFSNLNRHATRKLAV